VSMWLNLLLFDELVRLLGLRGWTLQRYSRYLKTPEIRDRFKEFQSCIKDYDGEVVERPQDVIVIAGRAVKCVEGYGWEPRLEETLHIWLREVVVDGKALVEVGRILDRLREESGKLAGPEDRVAIARLVDALDLLLEHVAVQMLWFLEKPAEYIERMRELAAGYSGDAERHTLLSISAILLLRMLRKTRPLWLYTRDLLGKRGAAIEKLLEVAEELESFTATFQLMRSQIPGEELEVASSAKSVEELYRVLKD